METKELVIQIPDGMCIDESKSTFEKIVFKKKETNKPESWKEYCEQQAINDKKGYQINDTNCSISEVCWRTCSTIDYWRNVLPSRELAESFLAMMQLMSLREAWIHQWSIDNGSTEDWKPAWGREYQYCIVVNYNKCTIESFTLCQHSLSFPTEEIAKKFLNCFKDLIEIAKPLI